MPAQPHHQSRDHQQRGQHATQEDRKRQTMPKALPSCSMRCHDRNVSPPPRVVRSTACRMAARARIDEHDGAGPRGGVARFAQVDAIDAARTRGHADADDGRRLAYSVARDGDGLVGRDRIARAPSAACTPRGDGETLPKCRDDRAARIGIREEDAGERQHREHERAPEAERVVQVAVQREAAPESERRARRCGRAGHHR